MEKQSRLSDFPFSGASVIMRKREAGSWLRQWLLLISEVLGGCTVLNVARVLGAHLGSPFLRSNLVVLFAVPLLFPHCWYRRALLYWILHERGEKGGRSDDPLSPCLAPMVLPFCAQLIVAPFRSPEPFILSF